jgi:hypothetical protein
VRAVCIIVAAAALCLAPSRSALAIATEFVAFTGSNADPIHSSEIAKVDTRFQLPVYFGWPARDYEIIGTVYVHADETPASRLEIMRSAVAAAKARGATRSWRIT